MDASGVLPRAKLTEEERVAIESISAAWRAFLELGPGESDRRDFADAVHQMRRIVAYRVAVRADPDVWVPS